MLKHFKKPIVFITIIAVVLTLFYGINVSGASANWSSSKGAPTINDIDNGYTDFRVNSAAAMCSNDFLNLDEKDIFIENFAIPDKVYWARITFCQDPSQVGFDEDIENGGMNLYIQGDDSSSEKYQMFFFNGAQLHLGTIARGDNLSIRFLKTSKGYAMQINDYQIYHEYITSFCQKNYHKSTRVNLGAYDWCSGQIKICDRLWIASSDMTPAITHKISDTADYIISKADGNKIYTNEKISFDSKQMDFTNVTIEDGKKFTVGFDAEDKAADESDVTLGLTKNGDSVKVTLEGNKETVLGTIPVAPKYSFSISYDNGKYYAVINGTAFDCNNAFNTFKNASKSAYVSIILPKYFSFDVSFSDILWTQFAGSGNATVKLNADNSNHIEVSAGQNVRAPQMFDLFTTGIEVSNLDLSAVSSTDGGAYIYLGKTLNKNAPCNASANELTLFIKKTSGKVGFYLINSKGAKALLGEVTESNTYNISFSLIHKSRTLKINDTQIKLNKLTDAASVQAYKDIEAFLGTEEKVMTYIAFSANDNVKADLDLFSFVKPVTPVGFSVYNGKTYTADGDDTDGYSAKESKEAYMVSNTVYAPTEYALYGKINNVAGPVYFALSTTDVSDTNFWVCGNGTSAKRFVFVITPDANNTKAKIAYYGADGVNAVETVIDTVDFNWSEKHSYDVRQADDGNWYLNIDAEAYDKAVSVALNDFMNTNSAEELFYIIGSKKGIGFSGVRFIKQQVASVVVEKEGWNYEDYGPFVDLEKDTDNTYYFPGNKQSIYAFRNGTENITETSVKINIKDIKAVKGKRFFYFALSHTDSSDIVFSPKGTIDEVKRVIFRMVPDFENNKLAVYKYNDDGVGGEELINTIDYEFGVEHTFDVRMGSDGNWYLCVDNKAVFGSVFRLLQQFMERYGSKALYYGIGAYGTLIADKIDVVEQAPGDVYINTETWHTTDGQLLDGSDKEGYGIRKESNTYIFSDKTYDANKTSLKFSINDVGSWISFMVSKTDYTDTATLPALPGEEVNRIVFLLAAFGDTVQLQHWAIDGSSKTPTVITSYQFDWLGTEHLIDIRKSEEDDNWYFCLDGRMIMNKVSPVVNAFMEKNSSSKLHYGIGGWGLLDVSDIQVVDKQPIKVAEDGSGDFDDLLDFTEQDFGFDFEFDNVEQEETPNENLDFEFEADEDLSYETDEEEVEEEINPLDYLQKVKVKKRRLVSSAHGIIFTTFEKIAMIAGGVAAVGAVTFLVIFIIKKSKKRKMQ